MYFLIHPLGWINDERMAVDCLESGCIGLYIPPLGSVRMQYLWLDETKYRDDASRVDAKWPQALHQGLQ